MTLLVAGPAQADAWDMNVINKTGKLVKLMRISASPAADWSHASQTTAPLADGAQAVVHFDKPAGTCRYDLQATFSDATAAVYSTINVCDFATITIKFASGKPTYSAN
ncbi:MAG: hypothetical protein RLZZ08_752 [Pseudomonadota bacterium]